MYPLSDWENTMYPTKVHLSLFFVSCVEANHSENGRGNTSGLVRSTSSGAGSFQMS